MDFKQVLIWVLLMGITFSCTSTAAEKTEKSSSDSTKIEMPNGDSTNPNDPVDGKVLIGDISYRLSSSWEQEEITDSTKGYKFVPCSESYCNNLFVSKAKIDPSFEYLDWSKLITAYVRDLGKTSLLKITLLQDSFEHSSDSTWYELRYSYENERGDLFLSELHMIWPSKSHLYVFDFTAKDKPRGAFADFKLNAIQELIESIEY
ncbi:hypothetical protein [Croceimicrobium hydrocarbonivorans]|uniref:Lipoprotein n=1 Tax=Croceimicrobium hydrocarbonivorans TaxID=2761580 RepID=A0A7H0VG23_9FLAO|nr:hypothetical protein [Croceimicrobium hydrocarbonivorans]QNR24671.1 hypothetical protein H4K34_02170 [Croceimicrobium hydrocarbonivorans]